MSKKPTRARPKPPKLAAGTGETERLPGLIHQLGSDVPPRRVQGARNARRRNPA